MEIYQRNVKGIFLEKKIRIIFQCLPTPLIINMEYDNKQNRFLIHHHYKYDLESFHSKGKENFVKLSMIDLLGMPHFENVDLVLHKIIMYLNLQIRLHRKSTKIKNQKRRSYHVIQFKKVRKIFQEMQIKKD